MARKTNAQDLIAVLASTDTSVADDEPMQARVYHRIRQALVSGQLSPGQSITIRALAAALGTSPMPVRGALQRLVAENALEARPNRSILVPKLTRARLEDLAGIRLVLEGYAAELAATRVSAEELAHLTDLVEQMDQLLDRRKARAYLLANGAFHLAIYRAARSETLLRVIEALWLQIGPSFINLFTDRDMTLRLNDHHRAALEALRRRDPAGARKAVQDDIGYAARYLATLFEFPIGPSATDVASKRSVAASG